jgi:hypothetical protein
VYVLDNEAMLEVLEQVSAIFVLVYYILYMYTHCIVYCCMQLTYSIVTIVFQM